MGSSELGDPCGSDRSGNQNQRSLQLLASFSASSLAAEILLDKLSSFYYFSPTARTDDA
jgi:hypothetical protein